MSSKLQKITEKIYINFYLIYFIGIIGFIFALTRPIMKTLTPIVLFVTATYVILRSYYESKITKRTGFLIWSFSVFAVTIIMEIMGVKYGLFFGQYKYGGVLGPGILGVPIIIGINWLIVIMGSVSLMKKYIKNVLVLSLFAGLLAFIFDLVLEPAAISLGFWEWTGSIPIKNYISWFSITFVFAFIAEYLKLDISQRWSPHLLGAQFIFFIFIRIFMLFNLI